MQTQLQITFRDMPHSDALEAHVREKAAKLETLFSHIMACHVTVEQPHRHKQQGKSFCVHVDIRVPGAELVVNHHQHEDAYIALRDAFAAAKRQLEDHAHRIRGDVKHHDDWRRTPTATEAEGIPAE